MKVTVTVNEREMPDKIAGLIMSVLGGHKITRTGTVNPVTLQARYSALAEMSKNDALRKICGDFPTLNLVVTIPNVGIYSCTLGNLFTAGKYSLAVVESSIARQNAKRNLDSVLEVQNLRPQTESGESVPEPTFDDVADFLADVATAPTE